MKTVANVLWIIFGGLVLAMFLVIIGLVSRFMIIWIPYGAKVV